MKSEFELPNNYTHGDYMICEKIVDPLPVHRVEMVTHVHHDETAVQAKNVEKLVEVDLIVQVQREMFRAVEMSAILVALDLLQ